MTKILIFTKIHVLHRGSTAEILVCHSLSWYKLSKCHEIIPFVFLWNASFNFPREIYGNNLGFWLTVSHLVTNCPVWQSSMLILSVSQTLLKYLSMHINNLWIPWVRIFWVCQSVVCQSVGHISSVLFILASSCR